MRFAFAAASVLVSLLGAAGGAEAQQHSEIFQRANEAYFRGSYDDAVQGYRTLIESGFEDPDVAFNLATAYARQRRYGYAIRWFERALVLRPGDEGAEQGLAAARSALGRRRAEAQGEALVAMRPPLGEALVGPFSETFLAWLVLALDVLFFGILLAFRRVRREDARLALGIAAPIMCVLLVLASAGLAVRSGALEDGRPAVVLRENAPLHEGPDPRARHRGRAVEGERARILGRDGRWLHVRLASDREGWMPVDDIGAI
jgi:tetratricopeptide (TPR) repeat protein